jgi:hypothetical protein
MNKNPASSTGATSGSSSLPYGIVPSAPSSLSPIDINLWKQRINPEIKQYFESKYNTIMSQYAELLDQFHTNKLLYESDISFQPLVGKSYYLYERDNGSRFVSILAPHHTKWSGYLGAYRLTPNFIWEKTQTP